MCSVLRTDFLFSPEEFWSIVLSPLRALFFSIYIFGVLPTEWIKGSRVFFRNSFITFNKVSFLLFGYLFSSSCIFYSSLSLLRFLANWPHQWCDDSQLHSQNQFLPKTPFRDKPLSPPQFSATITYSVDKHVCFPWDNSICNEVIHFQGKGFFNLLVLLVRSSSCCHLLRVTQETVFLGVALRAPNLVVIRQTPGCSVLMETPKDSPQLILTWLTTELSLRKQTVVWVFLSHPLTERGGHRLFR